MAQTRPILGITMGDPAGIGPEITAKSFGNAAIFAQYRPLVIGNQTAVRHAVAVADKALIVKLVQTVAECRFESGTIEVLDPDNADLSGLEPGQVSALGGRVAFAAVRHAIELALARQIDALVTGPINKEALHRAGCKFSGHTEILAHFTGTKNYAMMLVEGNLRVAHVTTHVSLRQACDLIRTERIVRVIELVHNACHRLGIPQPRIGVASLNPHASDGGLFGDEEAREIIPALAQARIVGIAADGPIPADTLFAKAHGGLYDAVVAMYHDQGHIPLKLLGFRWNEQRQQWDSVSGVNITLGLPIIRTSVDHGTAFELAGKNKASPDSLLKAMEYAALLTQER